MAVVAKSAEAHRGQTVGGSLAGEGVKVVEHEPDIALGRVVAVDDDVAFPQVRPGRLMVFDELDTSLEEGEQGKPFGFVERVVVVGGSERGAHHGKMVSDAG